MNYKKYERNFIESIQREKRNLLILELERDLNDRLKPFEKWEKYSIEISLIIKDLRNVKHDLWSHGYDGDCRELWGWDYMRMETAGFLQIEFDFHNSVKLFWRGENDINL